MRQNLQRNLRNNCLISCTLLSNGWINGMMFTSIIACSLTVNSWGQAILPLDNVVKGPVSTHTPASQSGSGAQREAKNNGEQAPVGVDPPTGQHWHVQVNDRFDQDDSINQELWNGGTGGGMPPGFCSTRATSCGYTGDDCHSYFGSYPKAPFATIQPGSGLAIQATHAAPGDTKYEANEMADIQSYGKITIYPGFFVEWQAKMPIDRKGEGWLAC